jgi:hypothetical protein
MSRSSEMKHPAIFLAVTLFSGLFCLVAWNWWQLVLLDFDARNGVWYEGKRGKVRLMKSTASNVDVVFVGSSSTQNNVDTDYLTSMGLNSFNLGVSGNLWREYPYLVTEAAKVANKAVVISIPLHNLYSRLGCPKLLTLTDIIFFMRYSSCTFRFADILENLPMNALQKYKMDREEHLPNLDLHKASISTRFGLDLNDDPRNINFIRASSKGIKTVWLVLFSNGDGLVFSNRLDGLKYKPSVEDFTDRNFDPVALMYLKQLAAIVTANNKLPIFILEPGRRGNIYKTNKSNLANRFWPVPFIFNESLILDRDDWAAEPYLNSEGKRKYSKLLFQQVHSLILADETGTSK